MIELICFDCDGVLVDSERLAAATTVECLSELGIDMTVTEALALFTGKSVRAAHGIIAETYGIELPVSYQARYDVVLFQRFRERLQPVPGIGEVLAQSPMARCVTSNSGHARLALTLGVTGLAEYFGPHVFSAEDVRHGKPAPDLFFFAAARLGLDAGQCLVIDDSPTGIKGAVAAGARAIGFTGGAHCEPELADRLMEAGAFCTVETAADLMPYCA